MSCREWRDYALPLNLTPHWGSEMSIGMTEVAIVTAGVAITLWFLPKALPELGRSFRLFREELKRK